MAELDLARDVLDRLLIDRERHEMGRVDGIALELRDDAAPRVSALEVGAGVIGWRLSPMLGRLAEGLEHMIGLGGSRPLRVPFSAVKAIDLEIRLDVLADETPATLLEHRLRTLLGGTTFRKPPVTQEWVTAPHGARELRVERLLGRKVWSANHRAVGRLEEIRAVRHGSGCTVTQYVIGFAGALERLGLGIRLLLGHKIGGGLIAEWTQLDIAAPHGPTLTCPAADLRRE